jgi:hypothetical protein
LERDTEKERDIIKKMAVLWWWDTGIVGWDGMTFFMD